MDALSFLRADHESVLGMFEVLDGAPKGTGSTQSGLDTMVTNLVIAESQHEAIEEQLFWPLVRKALDNGDELADQAIAQEQEGKKLLQRLEDGNPGGEADYHEALTEFIKAGREHIAFEQNQVWPLLRSAVGQAELEQLGQKLATAKKIAPTRPHPDTPPPSALVQQTMGTAAAVVDHARDVVTGRPSKNPPDPQSH